LSPETAQPEKTTKKKERAKEGGDDGGRIVAEGTPE